MRLYLFDFNVFVALCFLTQNIDADQQRSPRILFGDDTNIEEFPYYAGLQGCGAAILSNEWVVTAAHCVPKRVHPGHNFVWVGGETFSNSLRVMYDKVVVHPKAVINDYDIPRNDIALLHLAKPLTFSSKVKAVDLPSKKASADPELQFVGRGRDETGRVSMTLKKMDVVRLSSEDCLNHIPEEYQDEIRPHLKYLEKINVCAKRPENKPGLCHGDSGSPLVQKNTLIGLASYIGVLHCQGRLGFYVNVATYVPWIKSVTGLCS